MAGTNGPVTDEEIARLKQKFEAMKRSENSTRWTARLVTVAIAAVAIIGVWLLLSPIITAVRQPEPYQEAFRVEFEENIAPALTQEARMMFEEVGPEVQAMAVSKLETRMPEISNALEAEAETLFVNLAEKAQDYDSRLPELEKKIFATVRHYAPELADEQMTAQMTANAQAAIDSATARILHEYFQEHTVAATEFGDRLKNFPISEGLKSMTDAELREHLKDTLAAYAAYQFDSSLSPQLKSYALHATYGPTAVLPVSNQSAPTPAN